jgi:hypothetical protein
MPSYWYQDEGQTRKGQTMKLNPREKRIMDITKSLANRAMTTQPDGNWNWGFLWAVIEINRRQKNGKLRTFRVKTLLTSGCPKSWNDVQDVVEKIPGVASTFVNMD